MCLKLLLPSVIIWSNKCLMNLFFRSNAGLLRRGKGLDPMSLRLRFQVCSSLRGLVLKPVVMTSLVL